jgi:hypothetical protein
LKWITEGPPVPELCVDWDADPKDTTTGESKVGEPTGDIAMKPAAAQEVASTFGSKDVPEGTSTETVAGFEEVRYMDSLLCIVPPSIRDCQPRLP